MNLRKIKKEIFISVSLILAYFATRFYHILSLPIFTDEAIYLRWSQIAKQDANWRFISLVDGKQPLFVWLTMISLRFFSDPLLAGRVVSVFAGLLSMIGLFFVGKELFKNKWIGFISASVYLLSPFALVYDRMALYDTLVGTLAVWSLYLAVLLVRYVRLDVGLILGMVMGAGALTKSNAFFNLPLSFAAVLLFHFQQKRWQIRFAKWLSLLILAFGMTLGFYSILRLSPFFHIISEKTALFVFPFSEWIHHPFTYFLSNLRGLFDWWITYISWPLALLIPASFLTYKKDFKSYVRSVSFLAVPMVLAIGAVFGIGYLFNLIDFPFEGIPFIFFAVVAAEVILAMIKHDDFWKEKTLLVLWFFIPLIYTAFFGKTLYPRFVLFMSLPLFPLIAFSFYYLFGAIKNKSLFFLFGFILIFLSLRFDYLLLTNFSKAPLPRPDIEQYFRSWPSGVGVKEAVEFFQKEGQNKKIYIATEGTFGLMPYSLELYLVENPNIKIAGFWPVSDKPPQEVLEARRIMPTYVVFYQPCGPCQSVGEAPLSWAVTKVLQIDKGNYYSFTVYKVNPQ